MDTDSSNAIGQVISYPTMCWSVAAKPSHLGVKMHNAGYLACDLDYSYIALGAENLPPVITAMRTLGVRGLGVSMPYKQLVIPLLDRLDPAVNVIGACNTVVNQNGYLVGHNTDFLGAQRLLEEADIAHVDNALVIGSGGTARAITYALRQQGMSVTIVARNENTAQTIAADFDATYAGAPNSTTSYDAQLVVNATPIFSLEDWPLTFNQFPHGCGLLDVHFSSLLSPLCEAAQARGWSVAKGWRMLLHQGAAQFELYTGVEAPLKEMGDVLLHNLV